MDEEENSDTRTQALEIAGRKAVAQFWDPLEPKLLVCETVQLPGGSLDQSADTMSKKPIASGAAAGNSEQLEVISSSNHRIVKLGVFKVANLVC